MDGVGGTSLDPPRPLTLLARLLLDRRRMDARPVLVYDRATDTLDEPECCEYCDRCDAVEALLVERILAGKGGRGGMSSNRFLVGDPTEDERLRLASASGSGSWLQLTHPYTRRNTRMSCKTDLHIPYVC
jgi:hypothetical protein